MAKGLDKQVFIYSLDTAAFYDDKENEIHKKVFKTYILKNKLKNKLNALEKDESLDDETKKLKKKNIRARNRKINEFSATLKTDLKKTFEEFQGVRELREDALMDNKIIGMFDSALTRTIGLKVDSVSTSLFVVRVFYFKILEDLIKNGFIYKGEKYIYFSSSAGQIRTKKAVFIKESLWKEHQGALTCGLSIEEINQKGGCNVNKLLAYKALTASASIQWNGFDIDRTIVVPDLETNVKAMFDYINRDTYEITPQEMEIPIEHTDGCGMILPRKSKKSFMIRLPYVKGLLVPFPFDKFAEKYENNKVVDIYGKEWDIIEDQVEVIFTASQFKMKKYYSDWQDYKERFKSNKCQAVKLNEEDIGEQASLNYQMIQSLTDFPSKELKQVAQSTIEDIIKLGSDKETMLRILGATKLNKYKNHFQEALLLYPEMLNDDHSKKIIKDKKKSMIRDARAAKLRINGRYTFLIPDLFAFCERLFLNKEKPKGLLNNGQVYCTVFNEGKVDILRSPHLYKEHSIRNNILDKEIGEWFVTQGIYTSIFDPISRILQFDNDGDKALVVQDDLFTKVAERNMEGVLPLYYEMSSAKAEDVTNEKIYHSLLLAFKANIGEVSNNITKVFNSDDIDLRVVKWLTAENNYIIDYAKSLYMPERPEWADEIIKQYIKSKVPYFFMEAKDKDKKNVAELNNSTVNKLRKIIPNKAIKFEEIAGCFDYKMLMSEEVENTNKKLIETYRKLDRSKKWLIRTNGNLNRREGKLFIDTLIRDQLKEIVSDEERLVNILVDELYGRSMSKNKSTLWDSFGDILLRNLKLNLKNTMQCESCAERIEKSNNKSKYCNDCAVLINREKSKERMRLKRETV